MLDSLSHISRPQRIIVSVRVTQDIAYLLQACLTAQLNSKASLYSSRAAANCAECCFIVDLSSSRVVNPCQHFGVIDIVALFSLE